MSIIARLTLGPALLQLADCNRICPSRIVALSLSEVQVQYASHIHGCISLHDRLLVQHYASMQIGIAYAHHETLRSLLVKYNSVSITYPRMYIIAL